MDADEIMSKVKEIIVEPVGFEPDYESLTVVFYGGEK